MKKVYDYVVDITEVRIQPYDVLLKTHELKDSNIILTDEDSQIDAAGKTYAEVVKVGKDVDQDYCKVGDIVLVVGGGRMIGFVHGDEKYVLSPAANISLVTDLSNFKIVKNMSATVKRNKNGTDTRN